MKRKIIIKYKWWADDKTEIKENHQTTLEDTAVDQIIDMFEQGYTSGELMDVVYIDENDPPDGIVYRGSWSTVFEND